MHPTLVKTGTQTFNLKLVKELLVRVILLALVLLVTPYSVHAEDAENTDPAVEYLEMTPKFTVNLAGPKQYLMINVQLLIEGEKNIEKVKKHMPALRHALIMLFSDRRAEDLATMEQREALRQETIDTIRTTLNSYENSDGFRDLFFTEFLLN